MVNLVVDSPQDVYEARVGVMPLFASISICEHLPSNVHKALEILMNHKSVSLDSGDYFRKPLLAIAQELFNLGYCHPKLVKLITSPDTLSLYLSKYSKEDKNYKRLLEIDQALGKLFQSSTRVPEEFLENGRRLVRNQPATKSDLKMMLHQVLDNPQHLISSVVTHEDSYIGEYSTELYIDNI
ncbi:uncharacterized protein LOC121865082 [Homarus americanus]|uniref:uncharacterized protein LOC121865082 n=1 Tax=Homarus americanus TaxID=6706 RepID=UPI001C449A6A|nr:uncharacterized protein LOC121865082 [Homarus americanus]